MRKRSYVIIACLLVAGWLAWRKWPTDPAAAEPVANATRAAPTHAASAKVTPAIEASPGLAFPLNAPSQDIAADLRLVSETIATYRSNFPQEGNPTGTNAEITAALTGKNKLRFTFVPPGHPAINAEGELCDRWGTPFFFHAESAARMEVRSAGPDRKLWNEDDITFSP